MTLPLPLAQRLQTGKAVLFLGAGLGYSMFRPDGTSMPDAGKLAEILDRELGLNSGSQDLAAVAQLAIVRKRGSRSELIANVQAALDGYEPDENVVQLTAIPWRAIYTTNYDAGIMRAFDLNPKPPRVPIAITTAADVASVDPDFNVPVYYLHGAIFGDDPSSILIAQQDYALFRQRRLMLFERLRSQLADSTFVYLGYSNQDPNWATLQAEMQAEFAGAPFPQAYRIVPNTDALTREILAASGTATIDGTVASVAADLTEVISGVATRPADIILANRHVPRALEGAAQANPAPVLRLLNSWELCNDADFGELPNTTAFLRGDRPNWGLIAAGNAFLRDVEQEVYDRVLDFATIGSSGRVVLAILGSAGYGVSTLLMQLAYRLARDKMPVYKLRPGAEVIEADVLLAADISEGAESRPVFVVDDAAWHKAEIRRSVHALSEARRSALFLLGSRLNEWRFAPQRLSADEVALEALSDDEVPLLLQLLGRTGELGRLENLPHDLQVAEIRKRHNMDLLVTLREVTEGRQFEAIIEDEYQNVLREAPLAAKIYQLVCAVSQEGEFLRDEVAARALDLPTSELFKTVNEFLDGVVIDEVIDAANGIYGFRARHRTIAQIVWLRGLGPAERQSVLLNLIRDLNLTYRADRDAFDVLVQSDELVDSMESLDAKIRYFELATRSDPVNPYVKQHFARMYLRADQLSSALGQIDQGLALGPEIRVLHHTKGVILSRLCEQAESTDVARRFMARAEEEFNYCIRAEPRDEYAYLSLSELYRHWAERPLGPEESTGYLRRAEEAIADGLSRTRVHDRLHIESSRIAAAVGDDHAKMDALKRAVEESGSAIARYIYGRELNRSGEYEKAIGVLKPVILDDPQQYRAALELAIAEAAISGNFAVGAAILAQSVVVGERDGRFVAAYGGMQFLAKDVGGAERTFEKGGSLPPEEQRGAIYRPVVRFGVFSGTPVELDGTVSRVRATSSQLTVPGYGSAYLSTKTVDGTVLRIGDRVRFQVLFRAKGALADPLSVKRA
jgi:tetratricopeptide (TPR) repeat protein